MARRKKRKKVIQLPTSTDNLIKSRARNLELYECYISQEWEDSREANIVVSRKHTNGNITFGIFLVDLALLGVKDIFYQFNEPEFQFKEIIENIKDLESAHLSKTNYNLVHNIIYGAVEYADDYGFKPHKSFLIGKYILEEDTDEIPIIDIDFGMNGMPTVFASSEKPMLKEINQLEEKVGAGNFNVFYDDENHEFDLKDEWNDEEQELNLMPGWDDDIDEMGVPEWDIKQWEGYLKQEPGKYSFRVLQYMADKFSYEQYIDEDLDAFKVVLGDAEISESFQEELPKAEGKLLNKVNKLIEEEDFDNAYTLLGKGREDFPDSFSIYLFSILRDIGQKNELDMERDYEELYSRFHDKLEVKCLYASWQMQNGNIDKIPGIFENKVSLKELYPHRKNYSENEIIQFCSLFIDYYLAKDDLKSAEPYYQVLDTIGYHSPFTQSLIQGMVMRKLELIKEEENKSIGNLKIVK